MRPVSSDTSLTLCLRLAAFACLAGWAWVHLYWQGSYGALVWNETTYALAERLGMGWEEFFGTGANDGFVQKWLGRIGWLYLVGSVLTLTMRKGAWLQMTALTGMSLMLAVLFFDKYLETQRQLPIFIEHGSQMLSPLLLVSAVALGPRHRVTMGMAVVAVITTFAGHGCYAIGWLPTPGIFYGMTTIVLGVEYETAKVLLRLAGGLDFVVCVAMFIPALRRPAALYAAIWGLLTALARPMAGMAVSLNYFGADQFVHEAVVRLPHALVPLFLFWAWRKPRHADGPAAAPVAEPAPAPTPQPAFN